MENNTLAKLECGVCIEKYNKSTKSCIECGFCNFAACKACYKQYINTITEDVNCMSCKKNWTRSDIHSKFDAAYINTTLKKRRETILYDREQTLMAETQPAVERIKFDRSLQKEISIYEAEERQLQQKIRQLYHERFIKLSNFDTENNTASTDQSGPSLYKHKLIKKCTFNNCKGFLSSVWKCGLCNNWTCPECFEVRGTEKNEEHTCNPDNLATAQLIKKDTRSCPNCNEGIYKIEGCSQMFCTSCKTPFDWNTGKIVTGNIHNPHYNEWRRQNNNYDRDPNDVVCGRELTNRFLNRLYKSHREDDMPELKQYEIIIREIVRKIMEFTDYNVRNYNNNNLVVENRNLRIDYLLDNISEDHLKIILQRKEKHICKRNELINIYTMFVQCSTDILYRLSDRIQAREINNNQLLEITKDIVNEIHALREYTNNCLVKLGKVYNSSVKTFNDQFHFVG